ncbi:photosynthetic complex putative assembly protein PuhB [Methylobacterium sp. NEAU 140]|uniref:photosynthetic complex putative assembly protein PuhB n=1 Tax=Methylobacterium sp. NEAU 140 TaxID=3064945 RepID=UPI002734749A|nr:photosynthetic complex putative assembly protein PuhB [Methylobacterium sp. NEAU 140]MDP4025425.1 photosynthetic complex putative assembly protein PuhB [Methylobacterium sp. NEAU 140]
MSGDFLPEGTLRGLPGPLPRGERILWQGAPTTAGLLVRVFHARLVVLWFAACALAVASTAGSVQRALMLAGPTVLVGAAAVALLWLLAYLTHRSTVYTITDRRVVLQVGIALPVTHNLPFAQIENAGFRAFTDGSGDLPLRLQPGLRVAYLQLWPHARPWRLSRTEPMLRSVPEADTVARLLARALEAHADGAMAPVVVARARPAGEENPGRLMAAE